MYLQQSLPPSYGAGYARQWSALHSSFFHGLRGAWSPNLGPTSNRLADMSNYGTNLTANDQTNISVDGGSFAVQIDGDQDYFFTSASPGAHLAPAYITTAAWVKVSALPGSQNRYAWNKRNTATSTYSMYLEKAAGKLRFSLKPAGDGSNYVEIAAPSIDTWYHWAGTYDGSIMRLYVDGTEAGTNSTPSGPIENATSGNLAFADHAAHDDPRNVWDGWIDDFLIWDHALSATEIRRLYDIGRGGIYITAPVYYPMGGEVPTAGNVVPLLNKGRVGASGALGVH